MTKMAGMVGEWEGGSGGRGETHTHAPVHTHTRSQLIHIVEQQKLMQHCKAIIFQLKKIKRERETQE